MKLNLWCWLIHATCLSGKILMNSLTVSIPSATDHSKFPLELVVAPSLNPSVTPPRELSICPTVVSGNLSSVEYTALFDLYTATNGQQWQWNPLLPRTTIWNFTGYHNPCLEGWQGLVFNTSENITCFVSQIILAGYRLVGTLPQSLVNMSRLHTLGLWNNQLNGSIPSEYQILPLVVLKLDKNQLTGPIYSWITNCTQLTVLNLYDNSFHGSLPSTIDKLSDLEYLGLGNSGLSGTIPNELCNCSLLSDIDFGYNKLSGTVPVCIFTEMTRLHIIDFSFNHLSGNLSQLPTFSYSSSILIGVYLDNNWLEGPLPSHLTSLPQLRFLELDSNYFTGKVPIGFFTNNSVLETIALAYNLLTGNLPPSASSRLRSIVVTNNFLSGTIPSVTQLPSLTDLILNYNMLTGPLPLLPPTLSYLNLDLEYNSLNGTIPSTVCDQNMIQIILAYNMLTGQLPSCFGQNQTMLAKVIVDYNFLTGTIPSALGQLRAVSLLDFSSNYFTGTFFDVQDMDALQTLYIQNNFLTGNLSLTVNNFSRGLSFVDVSSNEFTGRISSSIFRSTRTMQSFSAATNCLSGSIPVALCELPLLQFLDLDGMSTAKACRNLLFPNLVTWGIDTFTLKLSSQHLTIPECLFSVPTLQTLHLSGNELGWSIPDDLVLSSSLNDLSLSHNKITGAFPNSIFRNSWLTLDLSYNKITGVLNPHMNASSDYSLSLQVNRLSGYVPHALLSSSGINILNGNLFDCGFRHNNLPIHDHDYVIYQCGSESFEQAIIIWCTCLGVCLVIAAVYIHINAKVDDGFLIQNQPVIKRVVAVCDVLVEYRATLFVDVYGMKLFANKFKDFRGSILLQTLIVSLIGMPLFAVLTVYFKTLTFEYAWIVSAAYLSGEAAAIILLVYFVLLLVTLVAFELQTLSSPDLVKAANYSKHVHLTVVRSFQFLLITLLNIVVMLIVNGCYVYVILNFGTVVIFFAQVTMALLKLFWNDFAIRAMVLWSRSRIGRIADDVNRNIAREMPTVSFIVLFNTIVAPCLATMAVDPSCFVNAVIQQHAVLPDYGCGRINSANCTTASSGNSTIASYDPPFIYQYQCSSAILTNYASVYVYMFLFVAFIKPIMYAILVKVFVKIPKGSCLWIATNGTMHNLLKPVRVSDLKNETKFLFRKERFVLRLISKLAVFLTFGVVFPPIAVVLCVAFYSETYLNEIVIGRFLHSIQDESIRMQFAERLRRECEGIMSLLHEPLLNLVIPFAAMFYACFIFDIYGDQVGWRKALWAVLTMLVSPWVARVCFNIYSMAFSVKRENGDSEQNGEGGQNGDDGCGLIELSTFSSVIGDAETVNVIHIDD